MSEPVGEGTPTKLDDPVESAGGSAPPDAPGPGAGIAGPVTALTGAAQSAANDVIDGLEAFANHVFDIGEAGLQDALKVVDAAQTGVSHALAAVTAKVTGGEAPDIPTIPTGEIAGSLTNEAQQAADKLLNGLQVLANEAFDLSELAIADALTIVDEAQTRVSGLLSSVANLLAGKLGG